MQQWQWHKMLALIIQEMHQPTSHPNVVVMDDEDSEEEEEENDGGDMFDDTTQDRAMGNLQCDNDMRSLIQRDLDEDRNELKPQNNDQSIRRTTTAWLTNHHIGIKNTR